MKIQKIDVYVVKIPYNNKSLNNSSKKYITKDYYIYTDYISTIYSNNIESVFLKITTDDGIEGWGEILAPTSPEVAAVLIKTTVAPLILGEDPMAHQQIWNKIAASIKVRGYNGGFLVDAMAGVDMALWDIKGKACTLPVYKLLGGKCRESVPCYMSNLVGDTIESRMESVEKAIDQGYKAIKIHHMCGGSKANLKMIETIRKKYDQSFLDVGYDAHWIYSSSDACLMGTELDQLKVAFFEAPVNPENIKGHKIVADAINTAVAGGENLRTLYTFHHWIESGALELLQPDIGRVGMTDIMRISTLAEANHLLVAPHLSVHQMVGFMATLHAAISISNLKWVEYQPFALDVASKYSEGAFNFKNANLNLLDQPGLGVEVHLDKISQYISASYSITND